MANTKQSKKRILRNERARVRNRVHLMRARTEVKKARLVIAEGQLAPSAEQVKAAIKALDMAATKGVIHKNNASRRKSRLMKLLNRTQAAR